MIIWDDAAAIWVSERIDGCARGFGPCKAAFVFADKGPPIAGVVFHDWNPERGSIQISAAAENARWATRRNISELFNYPFSQLSCRIVIALISEHNRRARRLWRAFGSEETLVPGVRGDDEAEAVYVLSRKTFEKSRFCVS